MDNGLQQGTALNVNIPAVAVDKIQGVSITRQGMSRYRERYERRIDPRGNVYYWLSGEIPVEEDLPDGDAKALENNKISITPINYDLTCVEEIERLRSFPLPSYAHMQKKGSA